jgi:DNA-binding SARP family transcriptional activator/class 3 adenylate cyclase/tetratricopeptide (TPR) repeat protein
MDFRILGPLEVRDRGRSIELRRRKPRALLAVLVLHAGEPVTSDALIDSLWGETPPRTARAALQNYVAQLRRALGPGVLASGAGGYVLEVGSEQIDLGRFERLAAEGREADGDERVEKLREALALWHGPPLADLAFEPFAAPEIPRLEELRTAALEDLIDAELSCGAGSNLVAPLEELIAEHPFRERLRGQLMLALYRSGRQADALEAYQRTRDTLVDELGIEPSAPLRQLEQAILRQDSSIGAPLPARSRRDSETPPEERRKSVTIVFADITFPEAADPELLQDASVRALGRVRTVLEGHGATIEQRAGDEVMAVFGIPHVHEDDALRAARSALELKREITALADVLEHEGRGRMHLRIGIETGEVLAGADEAGHGFAAGPAITLAKRTLQRAGPGEILAGPATIRLLGDAVVAAPAGDRRGHVSRLVELIEGVPALARQLEAPFVNRNAELAASHAAFAHAVEERRCRLFLVLGEAGIGKTRLASALAAELDAGAAVFVGRCVSYGKGATYLPLAEIVRQVGERHALGALLAGDDQAELISARLAGLTGDEEAPGSGGETFWAVRRLFESLARERPLVLVFEDLHWAEPTLLDLLEYLTDQVSTAPILLLGLARSELLEERSDWSQIEATTLAPLSSDEGKALLENLGEAPGALGAEILRTAGGNPLFIEQLLAHATEGGDPKTLPPSLDALLASRLDRLATGELSVLQRASVAGREFSRGAVVHLAGKDEVPSVHERLQALVRSGLIHESGPEALREGVFRFHHVLIRDAAYRSLPKSQRAELHERFARWLESRSTRSDELIGFHLEQAHRYLTELGLTEAGTPRLAVEAGERLGAAGLRAAKSGDTPAASNLLGRATSLLGAEEVVRRDLLPELGLVLWRGGDIDGAERVFEAAIAVSLSERDRRAELRARIELANLRLRRAREAGAEELLALADEAIPVLERFGDDRALGRIWYVLASTYGGLHCQYRKSADAAGRALHHFRKSDWPLMPCLQELAAGLYYGPTTVADAIRRCEGLLAEADRGGEAQILMYLAGLEAMAGNFDTGRSLAARALRTYEELAWTVNISTNHAPIAADIELLAGDFSEAERLVGESCRKLKAWGLRAQLATQAAQLGEALYGKRRYEEALSWSEVAESCTASYDVSAQFSWRALRAKALARQGEFTEAEVLARQAVAHAAATDSVSQHAHVLLAHAEVLSLEGRIGEAAKAIDEASVLLEAKKNVAANRQAHALLAKVTSA